MEVWSSVKLTSGRDKGSEAARLFRTGVNRIARRFEAGLVLRAGVRAPMTGRALKSRLILDLPKAPFPAIFAYGFRPFFLSAGCYAVIAMGCWLAVYAAGASPPTGLPPQLWHAHEMVFGFVAAAIAGFLLTAVPSWTGRQGYSGRPLALLVSLWLAGRIAVGAWGLLAEAAAAIDLAFFPGLALTLARR